MFREVYLKQEKQHGSDHIAIMHQFRVVTFFFSLFVILIFGLSPGMSLLAGLFVGLFFGQPFPRFTKTATKYLLQISIVGLGFGMNLNKVMVAGKEGFVFTLLSLIAAMSLGWLLGKWLGVDRKTSYLISTGTAICGGSAIAAVSQAMDADDRQISVSIGIVFILNAVALIVFPAIGHWLSLDEHTFGLWSAIAIHDTSSVVGAAAQFGDSALMTAATVKLARALWIIPMTFVTAMIFRTKESKFAFPWFILFFLAASSVSTFIPFPYDWSTSLVRLAKTGFVVTLFLIGTGISKEAIKHVGVRPLLQAVILWLIVLSASLFVLIKLS